MEKRISYTTFQEFPSVIREFLERADCWRSDDVFTDTRHIRSRNLENPLTDEEKDQLKRYLEICMFPMDVVFDN